MPDAELRIPQLYVWGLNGRDTQVVALRASNGTRIDRLAGETCDALRLRVRTDPVLCPTNVKYNVANFVYSSGSGEIDQQPPVSA